MDIQVLNRIFYDFYKLEILLLSYGKIIKKCYHSRFAKPRSYNIEFPF